MSTRVARHSFTFASSTMIEIILWLSISLTAAAILLGVYLQRSIAMCTSNVKMKGKVVIVTGANGGIGFHTAKSLAARGARVILACRSQERGDAARDSIIAATGNHDVIYKKLDLASLASVRQFAADVLATEPQLHVLVNNAGVYGCNDYTRDGIVESMQVNYFGHFLLTLLLLPLLKKSQSRIINLSSILHFFGTFNPETINVQVSKSQFLGTFYNYCNSKICMLMFTLELSRRLEGTGVVAHAVHPGVIMTGITKNFSLVSRFLFWVWCLLYMRTAAEGAQTVEHVAVDDQCALVSGKYYVDCASRLMLWKVRSEPEAKKLWKYSEEIVGYRQL